MKTVYVNPIKFERLKRYMWRECLSDYPTLIKIGKHHTGAHLTNVVFSKDNSGMTASFEFRTYDSADHEAMTCMPMRVELEFGEFHFGIVDIVTHLGDGTPNSAQVIVRVSVTNRAGRYSDACSNFLKRFMG